MRTRPRLLTRLPFFAAIAVIAVFSIQAIIFNMIHPPELATALSITSITADHGPTVGGNVVTITGDFGIPNNIQVAAGRFHSLALDGGGNIFSWGSNWSGQLGNGIGGDGWCDDEYPWECHNHNSSTPVAVDMTGVLAGRRIIQLAAATQHSLALDDEGNVFAWGNGGVGLLGNGANIDSYLPVAVDMTGVLAGKQIIQIAAGNSHSLALDSEGNVFAWGWNFHGQLGNGIGGVWGSDSNIPVAVDTSGVLASRSIVKIVAGLNHSLALDSEGRIFAWGDNSWGQLGNGTNTDSNVPVAVNMTGVLADRNIVQVVAGDRHSAALDDEGNVFTWGSNFNGQLGNGTNTDSNIPIIVDTSGALADKEIVQLTAGQAHILAMDTQGQLFAWGSSDFGQLGNGVTGGSGNIPVEVDMTGVLAGRDIVQIAAGGGHSSFVLDSKGNVFAWGWNMNGFLGNGTNDDINIPVFSFSLGTAANPIQSITLGGLYCTNIQIINPNTITCIVPAHPAGTVDVTVNTTSGSVTLHQGYTFVQVPDVPNTGHQRL